MRKSADNPFEEKVQVLLLEDEVERTNLEKFPQVLNFAPDIKIGLLIDFVVLEESVNIHLLGTDGCFLAQGVQTAKEMALIFANFRGQPPDDFNFGSPVLSVFDLDGVAFDKELEAGFNVARLFPDGLSLFAVDLFSAHQLLVQIEAIPHHIYCY